MNLNNLNLCQFFSNSFVSQIAISHLTLLSPKNILELGAGDGSLLNPAIQRWREANYSAFDIDEKALGAIRKTYPFVKTFKINALKDDLNLLFKVKKNSFDIAFCNPPYQTFRNNEETIKTLTEANLINTAKLKTISTDIYFLALNLIYLRTKGELSIIVPDSILTRKDYFAVRKDLIENHELFGIIELPDKVFRKTEAKTHILFIRKNAQTKTSVKISVADQKGNLINKLVINKNDLIDRMDYSFFQYRNQIKNNNYQLLEELNPDIKRGSYSKKSLENMGKDYFHLDTFNHCNSNNKISFSHNKDHSKGIVAKKGDILLSRVGKRTIGRIAFITKGECLISDCIFRIRVEKKYQQLVFQSLTSSLGNEWMQAYSHGVCAKVISKSDLLKFPLFNYAKNE